MYKKCMHISEFLEGLHLKTAELLVWAQTDVENWYDLARLKVLVCEDVGIIAEKGKIKVLDIKNERIPFIGQIEMIERIEVNERNEDTCAIYFKPRIEGIKEMLFIELKKERRKKCH